MAGCTFRPKTCKSTRNAMQVGVTREFVQRISKPKTIDKDAKLKWEEKDLKACTFMPKVNKPRRAKTHRPKEKKERE